jgi:outer membrane immunogenic protein
MTLEKLIRTGAAALGVLAIASQAYAADIYTGGGMKDAPIAPPPPPLWTGFYAGIHLGAAWVDHNNDRNTFYDNCAKGCEYKWGEEDPVYYSNGWDFNGKGDNSATAFGGGQFGYNWMPYGWTSVVLGIEVDIDGLANNNERTFVGSTYDNTIYDTPYRTGINTVTVKREGGFAGDVTGRLGWTWGPAMIYAKGGFAWLESKLRVHATSYDANTGTYASFDNNGDWHNDDTLTGWTVGGGVEWLLSPSWSAKIEYLHFDFTSNDQNWNPTWSYSDHAGTYTNNYNNWRFRNDLTADTVKLGINYHLNSGYQQAPLK